MEGRRTVNNKPSEEAAVVTSCIKNGETETKLIPIIVVKDEYAALRQLQELFRLSQIRQDRTHFNDGRTEVSTSTETVRGLDFDRGSVTENLKKRANLT